MNKGKETLKEKTAATTEKAKKAANSVAHDIKNGVHNAKEKMAHTKDKLAKETEKMTKHDKHK